MTRFRFSFHVRTLAVCIVVALTTTTFGFVCSSPKNTFTLKRYSSIPPIVRWTIFSSDCKVTILDPPRTENPFTFTMSQSTCDSLESLCAAYGSFDTMYVPTGRPIPNPSSMDFEFQRDGIVKTVHMNEFPTLPPKLEALLQYASRIENQGIELRQMSGR